MRMHYTHSNEDPEMRFGLGNVERQTQAKMLNMFEQYKPEKFWHEKQRDREKTTRERKQEKEERHGQEEADGVGD
jgi:hypothetical protein